MLLAQCIVCGCTDDMACWDATRSQPCHWIELARPLGIGLCSTCADHRLRWLPALRAAQARLAAAPGMPYPNAYPTRPDDDGRH